MKHYNKKFIQDLKDYGISIDSLKDEKIINFLSEKVSVMYNQEEVLDNIFNSSPITISCVNKNLEYVKVNSKMAQIVQKDPNFFIGKKVGEFTSDKNFMNFIIDLFESKEKTKSAELHSIKNNKEFSYLVTGSTYNNGELAVIIGMDITTLKQYEKNSAFSEKMKDLGTLCSGIAHEINNPLQAINTNVDLIELDLDDVDVSSPESVKEFNEETLMNLNQIRKVVKRASQITDSLRAFSRNTQDEEKTTVELGQVINDAVLLNKHKTMGTKFDLTYHCPEDLKFQACEVQLIQVFVNFLSNSLDAVKDLEDHRKWVSFDISKDRDFLYFDIRDGGNGIPLDIQAKIFEAFFTTKGARKGTGLGLSISKNIIEKHNGNVKINNDSPTTHFTISIPL